MDPSGHFFFALLIGALIGAITAGLHSDWSLRAMLLGAGIGALSGGVFAGVSGALSGAVSTVFSNATVSGAITGAIAGAAAGAVAGGVSAAYHGGNVMHGLGRGAGFGALGGAAFGAIGGYFGEQWSLARVGAQTLAGGGVAELSGGDFKEGAFFALATSASQYVYNKVVGFDVTAKPGGAAVKKGPYDMPVDGADNFGTAGDPANRTGWARVFGEGAPLMRAMNRVPTANANAGLHDVWQVKMDQWGGHAARTIFNVPGMAVTAPITYAALVNGALGPVLSTVGPTRSRSE